MKKMKRLKKLKTLLLCFFLILATSGKVNNEKEKCYNWKKISYKAIEEKIKQSFNSNSIEYGWFYFPLKNEFGYGLGYAAEFYGDDKSVYFKFCEDELLEMKKKILEENKKGKDSKKESDNLEVMSIHCHPAKDIKDISYFTPSADDIITFAELTKLFKKIDIDSIHSLYTLTMNYTIKIDKEWDEEMKKEIKKAIYEKRKSLTEAMINGATKANWANKANNNNEHHNTKHSLLYQIDSIYLFQEDFANFLKRIPGVKVDIRKNKIKVKVKNTDQIK
ncbi:MAG: hypothetical protein QW199_03165 [Candidatus Pacearchaeota archaeon]